MLCSVVFGPELLIATVWMGPGRPGSRARILLLNREIKVDLELDWRTVRMHAWVVDSSFYAARRYGRPGPWPEPNAAEVTQNQISVLVEH